VSTKLQQLHPSFIYLRVYIGTVQVVETITKAFLMQRSNNQH